MSIRGEFEKKDTIDLKTGEVLGSGYVGYIEFGGFKGRVELIPRSDTGGDKPDFDIHKVPVSRLNEIGAGWIKKKKNKPESYVSLSFTGEDFSRKLDAALLCDEPADDGTMIMIYSASRPKDPSE